MIHKIILFAFIQVTAVAFGQIEKNEQGSAKNLKGITEYNLVFDYTDVVIPNYDSEEDFLATTMSRFEEKELGKGDQFKKLWFDSREDQYEPRFMVSFNKRFRKGKVKVAKNLPNTVYTMKIHTFLISAGYNVGIARKRAEIGTAVSVFETANPSNILWAIDFLEVPGSGTLGIDFEMGYRISEAYAKLAKLVVKKIK